MGIILAAVRIGRRQRLSKFSETPVHVIKFHASDQAESSLAVPLRVS